MIVHVPEVRARLSYMIPSVHFLFLEVCICLTEPLLTCVALTMRFLGGVVSTTWNCPAVIDGAGKQVATGKEGGGLQRTGI